MRILLVEDETKLANALVYGLTQKGFAADTLPDGKEAYTRISLNHSDYDIIVLDLMLPGMDGITICKQVRERNITVPILILTARDEIEKKIDLLLSGADDYMVKPFSFDELCARIQALTRRPTAMIPIVLRTSDITLDSTERKVFKGEKEVPLTLKEFMLLEYFMRRPNQVINREELLSHLWDFNYLSFSNVVDVHIKNLRKKLYRDRENTLETVRGIGYRLKE